MSAIFCFSDFKIKILKLSKFKFSKFEFSGEDKHVRNILLLRLFTAGTAVQNIRY